MEKISGIDVQEHKKSKRVLNEAGYLLRLTVVILSLAVFFVSKKNYVYPTIFSAVCMAVLASYF